MLALLAVVSTGTAVVVHAFAAPLVFAAVASHYFGPIGAREPLPTAMTFTAIVAMLDLFVVAGLIQHSLAMFGSLSGTWLPLSLIFAVTWAVGAIRDMKPASVTTPSRTHHAAH